MHTRHACISITYGGLPKEMNSLGELVRLTSPSQPAARLKKALLIPRVLVPADGGWRAPSPIYSEMTTPPSGVQIVIQNLWFPTPTGTFASPTEPPINVSTTARRPWKSTPRKPGPWYLRAIGTPLLRLSVGLSVRIRGYCYWDGINTNTMHCAF